MTMLPIFKHEVRRVPVNEYKARRAKFYPTPIQRIVSIVPPVKAVSPQVKEVKAGTWKGIVLLPNEPQLDAPLALTCPIESQSLHKILHECAHQYGFKVRDLKAQCRNKRVCAARKLYYYRAAAETEFSYPQIGRVCGGRDHSTVMHGVQSYCTRAGISTPRGLAKKYRYEKKRGRA